jgi:surface polysaccharide O-acyltransferase-like enzyme
MKHKAASPFLSVISINKSKRNSSVELYRIVATITVLVVHYNGWFVGGMPDRLDLSQLSAFRIGQAVIESASCICVNMFLIISGYFGIRFKGSSLLKICLLLYLVKNILFFKVI